MRFGLALLNVIKKLSFNLQFLFWKYEELTGCQIRAVQWVGDDSYFVFRQKLSGEDRSVRRGVVMVKLPGMISPNFGAKSSHVFTQSLQTFAEETEIHSLAS
jgi:hypothetical protein